jgi:hypothetical protein
MGIRIPVEDSASSVAFEDAAASVFEALREVPKFRDPKGKQIQLKGTLALSVTAMMAGDLAALDRPDADDAPLHRRRTYLHGSPRNAAPEATLNQPCRFS